MPRDHFPRHLSMHRIRIIQQRRTQKREAPIKQHPQNADGEENLPRTPREISCDAGSPKQRRHALLRNDDDTDFAETVLNLFEDLPDGVTSALGGDHNT